MATGSILLGIALFVLTGLFIARPFFRPQEEEGELSEYQLLLTEKEHLLDEIQSLDFDLDTGKLPTEVHEMQRARLLAQATAVLQAIDQVSGRAVYTPPSGAPELDSVDVDIEMEATIARLRRQRSQKSTMPVPDKMPAVAGATNGQARFCSQCGMSTDLGDKFCAYCGHNLVLESSTKTA